jgi:hypothetical protein
MPLSEVVVAQLELEDSLAAKFCHLSINGIYGTDEGEALKIRALVRNQAMLTLVDSGNSHTEVVGRSTVSLSHLKDLMGSLKTKRISFGAGIFMMM